MKRIIKLTESDLHRIVKRVISEQSLKDMAIKSKNNISGFGAAVGSVGSTLATNIKKQLEDNIKEDCTLPRNFRKVPVGNSVYRTNQPTLEQLKCILNNYPINLVIRMNGGEHTGVEPDDEKSLVESMGKEYLWVNAHQPRGGKKGEGYVDSLDIVQPLLEEGNVLIHCTAGKDRTGYQVAKFMQDNGYCGDPESYECRKKLWDYTVKYNEWEIYIPEGKTGYINYMEAFYPYDLWMKERPDLN